MLGLSYDEMMHGDIDYIVHRFNGWAMLNRHREIEDWKRARLIAFVVAKSNGATKAKDPEKFMPLNENKQRLTKDEIEKLKKGFKEI